MAVACILMNTIMMALGIVDRNGNTAATVMVMGVCSLVLPLASVFGLRWLCIRVLHVGDPLSFGALGVIGATVGQGCARRAVWRWPPVAPWPPAPPAVRSRWPR
ncbi:hypothetical protein [Bifidobacterium canis]|uniref:hypothetical protein n=1 Tax=Bifidobacterium canis TaxID=2610880 RepID=UPI0012D91163|nr:hypothetical protein [Bifidobacterium canis]